MRRAAKVDSNHPEIVRKLRQIGAYVLPIHQLKNCCDIFVGYRGRWIAFEIKDGEKAESARKLTDGEKKFIEEAGHRAPVHVVKSFDEAVAILTR